MQARFHASLRIVSDCIHKFIMQRRYVLLLSTASRPALIMGLSTVSWQSTSLKAVLLSMLIYWHRCLKRTQCDLCCFHGIHFYFYVHAFPGKRNHDLSITSRFLCCLATTYCTCNAWSSIDFCICIFMFSMCLAFLCVYIDSNFQTNIVVKSKTEFLIYRL